MGQKIIVVGGVALGPKAACRCMRLAPDSEITLFDENSLISYGGCGIPFFVGGDVDNVKELCSTPYQTLRDPSYFRDMKGFEVKTNTRVTAVDRKAKTVSTKNLLTGEEATYPYDKLVLATGARPRPADVPGAELKNVFTLTKLEAADAIRHLMEGRKVNSAVVVGGGFIGLEAAVAMADQWGVKVSVVEMMDQVLPGVLSKTLSDMARHDLESNDVSVFTGEKVLRMEGADGKVAKVVTDKREIEAQLVIYSTGFLPNGQLAKDAGLEVTSRGAIVVNEYMQTSDPDIYAGGDCCSIKNLITNEQGYLPLGSMANRQGRVIGTNLAGGSATFKGYVGTWAVKLFKKAFCGVGMTPEMARRSGFDSIGVLVEQLDKAHFYPQHDITALELVVEKGTKRVLGLQGSSANPDALKARIDPVAALLQHIKPTVEDISTLEAAYAPPFAAAMDVINAVGNAAENVLEGRCQVLTAGEFAELWKNRDKNNYFFIDARPQKAGDAVQAKHPDWHAISLEAIHTRWKEVPTDRPVAIICNTGLRSYDAVLCLARHGITNVKHTMGGMQAFLATGGEVK